jgi:hypothetical protein
MRLLLTTAACICLAGCAANRPVQYGTLHTPYNDADYAWSTAPGTASVAGQAFLRTNGGDVKTCAGSDVALIPDGAYTQEMLATLLAGQNVKEDEAFDAKRRVTQCNAQGDFKFTGLPAGKWLIQTTVTWNVPTEEIMQEQGGSLEAAITTSTNNTTELILSDRNLTAQKIAF